MCATIAPSFGYEHLALAIPKMTVMRHDGGGSGGYSFLIFFCFYLFWVKKIEKTKKKCSVRLRFLHKFSKAVNGFFFWSSQYVGRVIFQKKK